MRPRVGTRKLDLRWSELEDGVLVVFGQNGERELRVRGMEPQWNHHGGPATVDDRDDDAVAIAPSLLAQPIDRPTVGATFSSAPEEAPFALGECAALVEDHIEERQRFALTGGSSGGAVMLRLGCPTVGSLPFGGHVSARGTVDVRNQDRGVSGHRGRCCVGLRTRRVLGTAENARDQKRSAGPTEADEQRDHGAPLTTESNARGAWSG